MRRLLLLPVLATACSSPAPTSDFKADSAYSQLLDGSIADGILVSPKQDDPKAYVDAVRQQLYFSIGELTQKGGTSDANRAQVNVSAVTPVEGHPELVRLTYQAHLLVALPNGSTPPQHFQIVTPGSSEALEAFDTAFHEKCVWADDVGVEHLWHDLAPELSHCPLKSLATSTSTTSELATIEGQPVARLAMALAPSTQATQGRKPEYDKVWADGKLTVTIVFGKNASNSMSNNDLGVLEFRHTYRALVAKYGQPVASNVGLRGDQLPTTAMPEVAVTFATPSGPLDVMMLLVGSIQDPTDEFLRDFPERTKRSDLLVYSGHSGYGANIQSFVEQAQFVADQYQIFLVDGCLTFSYLTDALRDRHAQLNPGAAPFKYVDVVANAMPAPFGVGDTNIMALVNGLVGKTQTYRDILAGLSREQRAVVFGEEDN